MIVGGSLVAFNLRDMIPTHAPETWILTNRAQGIELSPPDQDVAFVRVGTTKGRLLGEPVWSFAGMGANNFSCACGLLKVRPPKEGCQSFTDCQPGSTVWPDCTDL